MSPLPKFEVMGHEVRAKGVLSGSSFQWFNRLIKDDEPCLGLIPWLRDMEHPRKGRGANGLVGGLGALKIP